MSRLYTRTGDTGQTGLLGGLRAPKTAQRFAAIGTLDELNAHLGLAVSQLRAANSTAIVNALEHVQGDLFALGAYLAEATPPETPPLAESRIKELESQIDAWEQQNPPLLNFILPGGSTTSAQLHVARAVTRRAERAVLRVGEEEALHPQLGQYLNRLSDWLFAAARFVGHQAGAPETPWRAA